MTSCFKVIECDGVSEKVVATFSSQHAATRAIKYLGDNPFTLPGMTYCMRGFTVHDSVVEFAQAYELDCAAELYDSLGPEKSKALYRFVAALGD